MQTKRQAGARHYVIIGNGIAGTNAAEVIRRRDPAGRITIIAAEPYPAYGRPLISYWLEGKVNREGLPYRPELEEDARLQVRLGTRAVRLDPQRHEVYVAPAAPGEGSQAGGQKGEKEAGLEAIPYDKLLLATGGRPIVPPLEGLSPENSVTFINLADAEALAARLRPGMRLAVLGGGLIGLKAAEALIRRGFEVVVLELAPQILGSILGPEAAARAQALLERENPRLSFRLGDTVQAIQPAASEGGAAGGSVAPAQDQPRYLLELRSGGSLAVDLLVVAIGVVPEVELAQAAGLACGRGVKVNAYLQTSDPDIYAAGDVVEVSDALTGEARVTPILPNAAQQGALAGANMTGAEEKYPGSLNFNSLPVLNVSLITMGRTRLPEEEAGAGAEAASSLRVRTAEYGEDGFRQLFFAGDRLVGAVLLNNPDRAGILRRLIYERISVVGFEEALLAPELSLLTLPGVLRDKVEFRHSA